MSLSENRINYGIHSICPFNITSGLPYGILKVLGGGTMTMTSEFEELFGGSSRFAYSVESKTISAEWTASVKSMPDFLFELFLGASVTTTAASATGTVSALTNVLNSSVLQAVTGIASVTAKAGSDEDLKDGVYIVKAKTATTVTIYALTDIEFKKLGATNDLTYLDDSLIVVDDLAIVTATAAEIVGLGVELTGGSGTIGMTVGDTARFHVNSAHGGLSEIVIGSSATDFPLHRQLCLGQKRSTGAVFELEIHRVLGSGMPIPFEEQTFAIPELTMKLIQDPCLDKVATIRAKAGISAC